MFRMPGGVGLRHHAAERLAEHDRLLDPKRVAERSDIVAPLSERPGSLIAGHTAPIAPVVDVNDLRDVGEPVEIAA
jgi:hypothetical protein